MKRFLGPGVLALSTTLFAQGVLAQIPVPPPPRQAESAPSRTPNPAPPAPVRRVQLPQSAPVPAAAPLRAPARRSLRCAEPGAGEPIRRLGPSGPGGTSGDGHASYAGPVLGLPATEPPMGSENLLGGQSIGLQTALYGALLNNPTLAGVRNNATAPTPESVEVARRFPTALNPTLWIDYRPITLIPRDPFTANGSNNPQGPYYHWGQQYIYVSLRQPLELGHQTTHRYHIARRPSTSTSGTWCRRSIRRWCRPTTCSRPPHTGERSTGWPSNWPRLTTGCKVR